ncbi:MAG TPA: methyltransferase domain-containing protein [Aggregatilineales bacterium]|nr:methyltransferase domain-containing protein [Aggregatilineales bacterium]
MPIARNSTNQFYDAVADRYHLFYRDWAATIEREGATLRRLFKDRDVKRVLDASCGTGTQAIALARLGYDVTATDPSQNMLLKAQEYAQEYGVARNMTIRRAGFLELPQIVAGPFDAVITKGNALPHLLTDEDLAAALHNFHYLLRPGGMVVIGIRNIELMLEDRPRFVPRHVHVHDETHEENILFDVWDWDDGPPVTVTFNTFIVSGKGSDYTASKYSVTYRALTRAELEGALTQAGFDEIAVSEDRWELVITARKA